MQEAKNQVTSLELELAGREAELEAVRHEQEVNQSNIEELQEQIKANQGEVENLRKVEVELLQVHAQLKNAQTRVSIFNYRRICRRQIFGGKGRL